MKIVSKARYNNFSFVCVKYKDPITIHNISVAVRHTTVEMSFARITI